MSRHRQKESAITEKVATVVLAGGQGTRLFPLTESRCKPAVSFGGRYRLIDIPISNSLNSHIHRIFVISQFFASGLNQHILATYHLDLFSNGSIELLSPEETLTRKQLFQGTADAVRQNLEHLLKSSAEYFLILSGDQLYNMDFIPLLKFAFEKDADLVIATLPVEEAEAKRMGLLQIDEGFKITNFCEKPQDPLLLKQFEMPKNPGHFLGSMGIYVFKRAALASILQEKGEDFGKHIIPLQIKKGETFAFLYQGYWEDIGTIASYYQANLALTTPHPHLNTYDETNPIYTRPYNLPSPIIRDTLIQDSLISQGAIINAKEISGSIIGIRAHIKKNTRIKDSIILGNHVYNPLVKEDYSIGENCLIQKAIIDEQTIIGNHVKLINQNNLQKFDGDGVYIRDGIIIVTTGTRLADGFIL